VPLQERAINGTTAIVAMTNTGYVDYTINLYKSMERVGLHRGLFIFCLNWEAQERLAAVGITSLLLADENYSDEFMDQHHVQVSPNAVAVELWVATQRANDLLNAAPA
jgi:hypothetical protein